MEIGTFLCLGLLTWAYSASQVDFSSSSTFLVGGLENIFQNA